MFTGGYLCWIDLQDQNKPFMGINSRDLHTEKGGDFADLLIGSPPILGIGSPWIPSPSAK